MRLAPFPRVNEVLDQRMVSAGNEENSLEGRRYLSSEVCIVGSRFDRGAIRQKHSVRSRMLETLEQDADARSIAERITDRLLDGTK